MSKKRDDEGICPVCKRKEFTGFLGGSQCKRFFCRECCVEFTIKDGKTKTYTITSSGAIE